jgi:hypothetical protein
VLNENEMEIALSDEMVITNDFTVGIWRINQIGLKVTLSHIAGK